YLRAFLEVFTLELAKWDTCFSSVVRKCNLLQRMKNMCKAVPSVEAFAFSRCQSVAADEKQLQGSPICANLRPTDEKQ
ncbi:hypothetical protein HAX54_019533, partial [Datura stramonium]|nr:hypothetical protein [Datura stramonium]